MKPFFILLTVFVAALLALYFVRGRYEGALAGRIAMAAMLLFTAIGHFAFKRGMAMMIPEAIPFRKGIVFLSGLFEILAAIGLLISNTYHTTGWVLIAFFILVLPANIYAALKKVNYQQATFDGSGPAYLWFRVPLQIFFIGWVYWSAIMH
ncbi:MAG TPA: hypothetical protein VG890_01065 [Puia sp.]|nr:hypothetical protein [Puia sp.]